MNNKHIYIYLNIMSNKKFTKCDIYKDIKMRLV